VQVLSTWDSFPFYLLYVYNMYMCGLGKMLLKEFLKEELEALLCVGKKHGVLWGFLMKTMDLGWEELPSTSFFNDFLSLEGIYWQKFSTFWNLAIRCKKTKR